MIINDVKQSNQITVVAFMLPFNYQADTVIDMERMFFLAHYRCIQ